MFPNATVSSRSSSGRSESCSRNSSMPSLRIQSPLSPRTSINPLYRHTDGAFTSFDASHFVFRQHKMAGKHKPQLRRYHSHDSQANLAESSDSKDNSPDSTHERSGGRSAEEAGSSPESTGDRGKRHEYEVKAFLDRYSLPRVVRIAGNEPILLYRCFDSFTKVQARAVSGKKGKEKGDLQVLHFPEGYPGWFSLLSEKGERCAVVHSTLLDLVREQVCSFLSLASFTAYTAHPPDPADALSRMQYLKTVVRGGQVFRLRAVFQHRDKPETGRYSTRSGRMSTRSARDKDLANRYAQLIDVNNQELYAPLTTKGEFYEIHSSTKARLCFAGMLDKTGPLALDKDCLYRLAHLLRRVHLPLRVRLVSGPGLGLKDLPDTFILDEKFQEPLLVTCTLPPPGDVTLSHEISCINLSSKVKMTRSMLGFDSEYKLFKSQRLQSALSYCHKNVEQWYRQVRLAPNVRVEPRLKDNAEFCPKCRKLKKVCGGKCNAPQEEEVRRYTETNTDRQLITKEVLEKFPKSKKWYRHFKILSSSSNNSETSMEKLPQLDGTEKVRSIDRYKDMSKLIEEKFGKKHYNPVKKSASFMFATKRIDLEETPMKKNGNSVLLKCQSLDTQLCVQDDKKTENSVISDEFESCILENNHRYSLKDLRSLNMVITEIDIDDAKPHKPDLIPSQSENFITERLCSEFHVKSKITKPKPTEQVHVVQVHAVSKVQNRALPVVDDLPYSHVVDEVRQPSVTRITTTEPENVYAEICEPKSKCECASAEKCMCAKRTDPEYCYVKLGSNGDSITQSSDDDLEAIYNTLR